jgi:hypothetical protein
MLLDLRSDLYETNQVDGLWRVALKLWAFGMKSPALFGFGGRMARLVLGGKPKKSLPGPLAGWSKYRDFPPFAAKSFRDQWRERRGR